NSARSNQEITSREMGSRAISRSSSNSAIGCLLWVIHVIPAIPAWSGSPQERTFGQCLMFMSARLELGSVERRGRIAHGGSCAYDRSLAVKLTKPVLGALASECCGTKLGIGGAYFAKLFVQIGDFAEVPEMHLVQIGAGFGQRGGQAANVRRAVEHATTAM